MHIPYVRMEDRTGDEIKKVMMVRKKGGKLFGAAGFERRTSEFSDRNNRPETILITGNSIIILG